GVEKRQGSSLLGPRRWQRRGGRWPQGGEPPQGAPVEAALGGQPHPRTSGALQPLGGALAGVVPWATAAPRRGWAGGGGGAPRRPGGGGRGGGRRGRRAPPPPGGAAAPGPRPP